MTARRGVRITGGALKGRYISIPAKGPARYTSSMVREALFNRIGDVTDARVLDLYAGAGTFSIEALSRGAAWATCVELDGEMARGLEDNLSRLGLQGRSEVMRKDVQTAVPFLSKKGSVYDIIFADPPYGKGYLSDAVELLRDHPLYHPQTVIILEHTKREHLKPASLEGWAEPITRNYGETVITILETT